MMKTRIIIIYLAFLGRSLSAQDIYKCQNGYVKFYSQAPLEDIEATLNDAGSALNIKTGEVAALIPIKSFAFKKALMQEHFNQNYMESVKYPTATFKGKIGESFAIKPGSSQNVQVSGDLTIHGVTQKRTIPVTLQYEGEDKIHGTSKFLVKLEDHKIKIPQLVFNNIAETIEVTLDFYYTLK